MKTRDYAVIMAGGKGTRFWPLSRPHRPKQLLRILGQKSLIRQTAERILPLFGQKNIIVVTVGEHFSALQRELSFLPRKNFLIEPQGNNTAPCIGLAAMELETREPGALMVVLPADHWISDLSAFSRTVKAALRLARTHDALVTIGIRPSYPETGYGYLLKGEKIKEPRGALTYRVVGFKEKPAQKAARRLLRQGALWNSGIFAWKASTILALLSRFSPAISSGLQKIQEGSQGHGLASPHPRLRSLIRSEYRKMPNISIDYAVLEKAGAEGKVLALEANFGWSDVGNWAAVHRLLPRDERGNAGLGRWFGYKSRNSLVHSQGRLAVLLGVRDLVVVDTPDALLVADLQRSQEVRDLVEALKRKGYSRYT